MAASKTALAAGDLGLGVEGLMGRQGVFGPEAGTPSARTMIFA
jgi:hypothetical protein